MGSNYILELLYRKRNYQQSKQPTEWKKIFTNYASTKISKYHPVRASGEVKNANSTTKTCKWFVCFARSALLKALLGRGWVEPGLPSSASFQTPQCFLADFGVVFGNKITDDKMENELEKDETGRLYDKDIYDKAQSSSDSLSFAPKYLWNFAPLFIFVAPVSTSTCLECTTAV
ncbi:hypothetical protein AAY473_027386, partial [Plecturocebus cupreus]